MQKNRKRKTLQELTIKDNFMFGAVMLEEENCRQLLELILGFPIEKVEVDREKSMIFNPDYKGIRLDILAKDEAGTHYNVEMQAVKKIKQSREMGVRYMSFYEMLKEERSEGREEGRIVGRIDSILELLEDLGNIPPELREKIEEQEDFAVLKAWTKLAVKAESIEQFMKQM